jgi:hypothetical protein
MANNIVSGFLSRLAPHSAAGYLDSRYIMLSTKNNIIIIYSEKPTRPKLRFHIYYAYQHMIFPTRLADDSAEFLKCVENFAVSYTFPTLLW